MGPQTHLRQSDRRRSGIFPNKSAGHKTLQINQTSINKSTFLKITDTQYPLDSILRLLDIVFGPSKWQLGKQTSIVELVDLPAGHGIMEWQGLISMVGWDRPFFACQPAAITATTMASH
jgi:hypothetical protein